MYEFITGKLVSIESDALIVEAQGIGYRVLMGNPYRLSDHLGQEVKVWLYLSVSQELIRLYGFKTKAEKQLFLHLTSVKGIGPASALSILALDDHEGLVNAINAGDSQFLTKFPGVGKKTAQQIVLDLEGKLDVPDSEGAVIKISASATAETILPYEEELAAALESLGYSTKQIARIIKKADFSEATTIEEAIRIALHFVVSD